MVLEYYFMTEYVEKRLYNLSILCNLMSPVFKTNNEHINLIVQQ